MKLASLLTPKQVILDLKGEVCEDAISAIVDHLVFNKLLDVGHREDVLEVLREREQQISTGIGSGVAIPHAFSNTVDRAVAVFARSEGGVDFEALDNAPVNFVILFIVPEKERSMHLQTLAEIAKMFNNCSIRKRLFQAETVEEVLDIFAVGSSNSNEQKTRAVC